MAVAAILLLLAVCGAPVVAQYYQSELPPPATPASATPKPLSQLDSVMLPFRYSKQYLKVTRNLWGNSFLPI